MHAKSLKCEVVKDYKDHLFQPLQGAGKLIKIPSNNIEKEAVHLLLKTYRDGEPTFSLQMIVLVLYKPDHQFLFIFK